MKESYVDIDFGFAYNTEIQHSAKGLAGKKVVGQQWYYSFGGFVPGMK